MEETSAKAVSMSEQQIKRVQKELNFLDAQKALKQQELDGLIEKLPIDENLVYFFGGACRFTEKAKPEVSCLEASIQKRVVRLEVWEDKANQKAFEGVGGLEKCGGVPFFFNKKTQSAVCGARSCEVLKQWALSNEKSEVGCD